MSRTGREALRIARLRPGASLPSYATDGAAGLDLAACVVEPVVIAPGDFARVPTGIAIALPRGFEGQVRPRSGLAAKHAVTVLNAPGTLDADSRGEIPVRWINHGREPFTVASGDRIAQLVVAPVTQVSVELIEPEELDETTRGAGGFGSTGV